MKKIFTIALVLTSSGCFATTSKEDVKVAELQAGLQKELIELYIEIASKPTYSGECKGPCKFEIFDGDELPPLPKIDHYVTAHEANASMFKDGADMLKFGIPWVAGTRMFSDFMDSQGGGNTNTHNTNTINGDDNDATASSTISSEKRTTGDTATTTRNKDDHSTAGSYNPSDRHDVAGSYNQKDRHDVSGSYNPNDRHDVSGSYNPNDRHDAVSVPTVVVP